MSRAAAGTTSRDALLGPNAQRLEVGLLSARTAAVLRRIKDGSKTDDVDAGVLQSAAEMMTTAAEAVEVVAAGGRMKRDRSNLGFGAMAFTVEQAAPPSVAPKDLPEFFRTIARDLKTLETKGDASVAEGVLPAFSLLADVATRQAGSVGEGGGSLI